MRWPDFSNWRNSLRMGRSAGSQTSPTWTEMGLRELLIGAAAMIDPRRSTRALRAARTGNVSELGALLESEPRLVHARASGNTTLEWLTQPGFAPPDPAMVDLLIKAGSEVDRALNLAGCWNLPEMCRQLLAAGADPSARADAGITPLESAAMHSSKEAADVLVDHGLHRPSLWLAAAAGQLEAVRDWVSPDLTLRRDPGPYRPNWADVGRPAGEPASADDLEIIGEALVFAALNDRRSVVDYLLQIGIDVDSRPYRNTTALHFAVQFHRPEMVRNLLDRTADVSIRDDLFGADAKGWAEACRDGSPASGEILRMLEGASAH
ncbi:MAG: ankyrin repeat domain-containing protein [Chloroflexi bacterium]|nr:ankyrin repeat domain-containing protein [Chloroflexota bacterium]